MAVSFSWSLTPTTPPPSGGGSTQPTATVRNLLLGPDGDLLVEDGNLALSTGAAAVAQAIRCRLAFFRGEWFADPSVGLPWHQIVFSKGTPLDVIRSALRAEVLAAPGVTDVQDVRVEVSADRKLTATILAAADVGLLEIVTEVPA